MTLRIGDRVRLDLAATGARHFGAHHYPPDGTVGTIVELPARDVIGACARVKWDNGMDIWMGSMEGNALVPI